MVRLKQRRTMAVHKLLDNDPKGTGFTGVPKLARHLHYPDQTVLTTPTRSQQHRKACGDDNEHNG